MLGTTGGKIMDLIGTIANLENRLGERKSAPGKRQSAQKKANRNEPADESNVPKRAHCSSTEPDLKLGQNVDTTA
jgi:hypothetical protein